MADGLHSRSIKFKKYPKMTQRYKDEAENECTQYDILEGYVSLVCVTGQSSDAPVYFALSPMNIKEGE